MKLHVHLRNLGFGSRRKAEELIATGRVSVNGAVAHVGQQVTGSEAFLIDGKPVGNQVSVMEHRYLVLNKPVGYTSTTATHFSGERSVLELLPALLRVQAQWQIVGRLDKNSEGLLLLTTDGNFAYAMTHPKFEVEKEYEVVISKELLPEQYAQLQQGVVSTTGEKYRFRTIRKIGTASYRVILTEGKKREIREAFGSLGIMVKRLLRIRMGNVQLGKMAEGEYREFTESEKTYVAELARSARNSVLK